MTDGAAKAPLEAHLPPLGSGAPGEARDVDADALLDGFLTYVEELGIEPYPAQEEAILELFSGKNVILNTPTGSGKSLVALALHYKGLAENRVSFYTAPIKALVNEKFFSLCRSLGADNVGLLTGDASVNASAPVVCATAEILASLALREGPRADVDYVVMDEFHYYSDRDRGMAWQVPLLTMGRTRFLLMSATLGETAFFEEELTRRTGAETALVKTRERPVPLEYRYAMTPIHESVSNLLEKSEAPIYMVHFTQRQASEQAQSLTSMDVLSKDEKHAVKEAMKAQRFDSPFGKDLKRWVSMGIGVHHAGMLPKYRLFVEKLAQRGLLKVICGTDTLGVGVNIPIRAVLFTQLCKYDGEKTGILTVRDFQQIAGRAGRKGFDDEGVVVAQAPPHVIDNQRARDKTGGDAKKLRKLKAKKPPDRGYAHWDEQTFRKLIESEPERLVSRFRVTPATVLQVLGRQDAEDAKPKEACRALRQVIGASHEARKYKYRHGRTALQILRSLEEANVVELGRFGARIAGGLQEDFSLNHALGLWVVEAVEVLDRESKDYALEVLTLVEATLEDPRVVIRKQVDTLKGRAVQRMKAEGIEYDERMAELEKIVHPQPMKDFLEGTFQAFAAHHPWVKGAELRPKSIARDLFEMGLSFKEYVKEYGLQRSEGVLLRHLSNAYKALVQSVPEDAKTDEVHDLAEWLGGLVRSTDGSLLDEWKRMQDPLAVLSEAEEETEPEEQTITSDPQAFTVLVRNAVWRVVQALSRRDYGRAAELLGAEADAVATAMAPYWETYEKLYVDPMARSPRNTMITRGDEAWEVKQVLADPEDHREWQLGVRVPLGASAEAGVVVVELEALGAVG
ncbi:MAG: DUF3516 domain-containing protein [Myxococcota bacterium]